ncbi:hypothetical protein PFICI_03442 [Pestalotiopsis fici W106-1]|uniref:Uncharacterized protein n=1 Tax=Pestalotiopsis fici (strain W106-1 / CGMCC3.15140) TaxID=1229662 RepID=W3XIZ8_PESFW|nr:uncharacterized protein PFICI_03442 [Pestalotiopsis fici W106-1]ETS85417.1 hypothetical protein PFICI_03442 [Pestalotiopsis fici W106-1]
MSYSSTEAYEWYENKEYNIRRQTLPRFETDELGKLIVTPGEVYCRVHVDDETDNLCHIDKRFFNRSNLCKHIRVAHGLEIAPHPLGALSDRRDHAAFAFYYGLLKQAAGNSTVISTSKGGNTAANFAEKRMAHDNNDGDRENMRGIPSYAPGVRCAGCEGSSRPSRACPTTERDESCLIWAAYAKSIAGPAAARIAAQEVRLASDSSHQVGRVHTTDPYHAVYAERRAKDVVSARQYYHRLSEKLRPASKKL